MAGLLIVNADDWGLDVATTDAIAECFAAGRVTSATAMVFMADSARAATLARAIDLPVGLHLNLSEPYAGATAPGAAQRRQIEMAGRFGERHRRWRRWVPDPTIRADVDRCVIDQLSEFEELYGRPPTHVDGHKHVHVSPTVARTRALRGSKMRRPISDPPGSRSPAGIARRVRHGLALSRQPETAHFFSIWSMREDLLAGRTPSVLKLAEHEPVEVMAHPGCPVERTLLMTSAWNDALQGVRVGTYEDLS